MARPVDYRKGRGSKGVHTEDETVPLGKKDQQEEVVEVRSRCPTPPPVSGDGPELYDKQGC